MGNRAKAEDITFKIIDGIDPSGKNREIYEKFFKGLSNSEFDNWIEGMRNGTFTLTIVAPNGNKDVKLSLERNRSLAKKLGVKIFERVTFTDEDGVSYTPNHEFNILRLRVRRTSQHGSKGLSVAEHTKNRNALTGQVSGKQSDAGSLTMPEVYILNGLGLKETLDELMGIRGGDVKASLGMNASIFLNGEISKKDIQSFRSQTGSSKTLRALFKAQHIDINL